MAFRIGRTPRASCGLPVLCALRCYVPKSRGVRRHWIILVFQAIFEALVVAFEVPPPCVCVHRLWDIGIRIEDDVLITDGEPEVRLATITSWS